jgi:hypothetical protein
MAAALTLRRARIKVGHSVDVEDLTPDFHHNKRGRIVLGSGRASHPAVGGPAGVIAAPPWPTDPGRLRTTARRESGEWADVGGLVGQQDRRKRLGGTCPSQGVPSSPTGTAKKTVGDGLVRGA